MSHTPGPWHVMVDGPRARPRMALVGSGGTMAIDCTNSGKTFAESAANAHLVGAAPDLLGACKQATHMIPRAASGFLYAAIRKAEGK